MVANGKSKNFNLDNFYHQFKNNCVEFGIQREIIDRYIGQVEDINRKNTWELKEEENEGA